MNVEEFREYCLSLPGVLCSHALPIKVEHFEDSLLVCRLVETDVTHFFTSVDCSTPSPFPPILARGSTMRSSCVQIWGKGGCSSPN